MVVGGLMMSGLASETAYVGPLFLKYIKKRSKYLLAPFPAYKTTLLLDYLSAEV
jgi:hypothetical protein